MKINANDLISRQTQFSARTLTFISTVVIFVDFYDLKPVDWPLLQQDLSMEAYRIAAVAVIIFGIVSLVVSWWGDYVAYAKWFKSNEVSQGTLKGMSSPKSTEPTIVGIKRRLDRLLNENTRLDEVTEKIREIEGQQVRKKDIEMRNQLLLESVKTALDREHTALKSLKSEIDGLLQILEEVPRNFSEIDRVAKFIIFIWFLGMPLLIGFSALALKIISE